MKIVGVGCGPGMLTQEAVKTIMQAQLIFGSDRAIELACHHIPKDCMVRTIDDFKALHTLPEDAVVLSTGDPMLAGLGFLDGEVLPGISSLQVACARLRIPLTRVVVVVAHGKGHAQAIRDAVEELKRGRIIFLVSDPKFPIDELYQVCADLGMPIKVALCEDLGYRGERIVTCDIRSQPQPESGLYSLILGSF